MGLGEAGNNKKTFDAPSNVLFIPAEYWAVNCCICPELCVLCDQLLDPNCGCEPGGGQTTLCELCCDSCNGEQLACVLVASGAYAAAVAACYSGPCTDNDPDDDCAVCLAAASAAYAAAVTACYLRCNACRERCTIAHANCTCPSCGIF